MAEGSEEDEETVLIKELEWLLEEQVHKELEDIQHTLLECSRRFPFRMGTDDFPVEEHSFMFRCLGRTGVDLMGTDYSIFLQAGCDHNMLYVQLTNSSLLIQHFSSFGRTEPFPGWGRIDFMRQSFLDV